MGGRENRKYGPETTRTIVRKIAEVQTEEKSIPASFGRKGERGVVKYRREKLFPERAGRAVEGIPARAMKILQ